MVLFMEKGIIIIIFMYAMSFSLIGAQFVLGDVFNLTLTDFNGNPLQAELIPIENQQKFNLNQNNSTATAPVVINNNPIANASNVINAGWSLFQLLSGTTIFNLIGYFGVPIIFITPFIALYVIFLVRTMIGLLKEFL